VTAGGQNVASIASCVDSFDPCGTGLCAERNIMRRILRKLVSEEQPGSRLLHQQMQPEVRSKTRQEEMM
jgi:hypothetical protein